MTLITFATLLLAAQVALLGATLWLRYLGNKKLFQTNQPLRPVRSNNVFFGGFSSFFDFLDRIPLLRRSGTANEFDLLKAITLTTLPIFLVEILINRPSAIVVLLSANVVLILINGILLAHPVLKRLSGGSR